MKDEEMAKEWFDKELYLESSMYNMQIEYYCRQAFLAGLKAGRQWHKVADGDLPKDEKDMLMSEQLILLIRMKGTDNLSISIGQYNFSTQEFSYPHIVGLTEIYAWKEIVLPELPKENK